MSDESQPKTIMVLNSILFCGCGAILALPPIGIHEGKCGFTLTCNHCLRQVNVAFDAEELTIPDNIEEIS